MALYRGEWTQVCVSCFFSPSPRCVWQQRLSPIILPQHSKSLRMDAKDQQTSVG